MECDEGHTDEVKRWFKNLMVEAMTPLIDRDPLKWRRLRGCRGAGDRFRPNCERNSPRSWAFCRRWYIPEIFLSRAIPRVLPKFIAIWIVVCFPDLETNDHHRSLV